MRTGKIDVKGTFDLNKRISIQASAPSSPASGDLWWETGTSLMWFWNGTYWLSQQLFEYLGYADLVSASGNIGRRHTESSQAVQYDLFVVDFCAYTYVGTTNNGSNYWTVVYYNLSGDALGSVSTSADSADTRYIHKVAVNSFRDLSAGRDAQHYVYATKVSSPGNLYTAFSSTCRWAHL